MFEDFEIIGGIEQIETIPSGRVSARSTVSRELSARGVGAS